MTGNNRQPLSHQARWLFRTLRAAELAGLDPAEVLGSAIAARDLAGARDIAAVLDARIRTRVHPLLPQPQGSWTGRVPRLNTPGHQAYLTQIAAMMDDAPTASASTQPTRAPPGQSTPSARYPPIPLPRRNWEQKAAPIAAYREMYGYDHPDDPIGPEPARETADQRAAWHQALAPLGPAGQSAVRSLPDGRLWLARDTYTAQTAWAPRHVGKELRLARLGACDAGLSAIRADAEAETARKTGDQDRAGRHETLAASYRAMRDLYQQQEHTLAQTMADREEWEDATAHSRHLAIAADAELRRRHPE